MPHPAPTVPSERIQALDTIRGFALLGILLMNILAFGLPSRAYFNPSVDGALSGADFGVFCVVDLLVEGVMRAVFSMLFGVGIALTASRQTRPKGVGIYYRRQFLLLGIGLVDTFVLLWTGDILVSYALAGMVLYVCRNWRPRNLGIAAGCIFAYLAIAYAAIFLILSWGPVQATAVQTRITAGQAVSAEDRARLDAWVELQAAVHPSESIRAREALKFEGSYRQSFVANAEEAGEMYILFLPVFAIWDAAACMLLGMALYKTGFFQGLYSLRRYTLVAVLGFACGLTVNGFELAMKIGSGYAPQWVSGASVFTSDLGRVPMALGFVCVAMIAWQCDWFARPRRVLAAVGRMALTNYILQSVFGLVIFHDFGLGLWNELTRHQLYYIVLVEWLVLIWFSSWWLGRYRFGPLEWLWRSLTYGRMMHRTRDFAQL